MPMPNRFRPEPSAPPIHMMDNCLDARESPERSPPPRYEEAISRDTLIDANRFFPPPASIQSGRQYVLTNGIDALRSTQEAHTTNSVSSPSSSSTIERGQLESSAHRARNRFPRAGSSVQAARRRMESPSSATRHHRQPWTRGRRERSKLTDGRHSSASAGGLSDGKSQDEDSNSTSATSVRSKRSSSGDRQHNRSSSASGALRSSGHKIKRGLENIAFFIIQILD